MSVYPSPGDLHMGPGRALTFPHYSLSQAAFVDCWLLLGRSSSMVGSSRSKTVYAAACKVCADNKNSALPRQFSPTASELIHMHTDVGQIFSNLLRVLGSAGSGVCGVRLYAESLPSINSFNTLIAVVQAWQPSHI